jgi:hypothetical protein
MLLNYFGYFWVRFHVHIVSGRVEHATSKYSAQCVAGSGIAIFKVTSVLFSFIIDNAVECTRHGDDK